MIRSNTCGELNMENVGQNVTLCGWVQKSRMFGGMLFVDLRDRYGITQLVFDKDSACFEEASNLGREYVVQAVGNVVERSNKNPNIATGDIEIDVKEMTVMSKSEVPPFTIDDNTDGGDELRMKYRYLDLRRNTLKEKLIFRHKIAQSIRSFLNAEDFLEIETPFLIKSITITNHYMILNENWAIFQEFI